MSALRKHHTDNHDHPGFDAVCRKYPDAVRIHYSESFFPSMTGWRVAYRIECGGGPGLEWLKLDPVTLEVI